MASGSTSAVNSGLGLALEFDSRDSTFTPSRGYLLMAQGNAYLPVIGSDVTFQAYRTHGSGYWPVGAHLVLGGGGIYAMPTATCPSIACPTSTRAASLLARHQDETVGVLESEVRWNISPRWAGIGFVGAGRAWGKRADFDEATTAVSKGLGMRYLVARQLGLHMGADYAWGPETGR